MGEARETQSSAQGQGPIAGGLPNLTYSQSTGALKDPDGATITTGWAGNHEGKNNPNMQSVHNVGPLPQGLYRVGPWEEHHPGLGPMVARLVQVEGDTFGRDGFFFHGPAGVGAKHAYGQESEGCVVVPYIGRVQVKLHAPEGSFVRVVA